MIKSPAEITAATIGAARNKMSMDAPRLILSAVLAGAYIAIGGVLSIIVGFGFPEVTAANPGMQRLLSGLVFPIGLVLVVVLGAELFTGNNAVLIPGCIKGDHSVWRVVMHWTIVYVANFVGAIGVAYLLVFLAGLTSAEPWHTAAQNIAVAKTSMPWLTVMLKGIGANWLVCLAVWLALSGSTLTHKVLGCWIPVATFVALGYEHSVANMFFIPLGMMEGASVSVADMLVNNLVPATIGNIIGGALLVGCVYAYVHLKTIKKT